MEDPKTGLDFPSVTGGHMMTSQFFFFPFYEDWAFWKTKNPCTRLLCVG